MDFVFNSNQQVYATFSHLPHSNLIFNLNLNLFTQGGA